MLNKSKVYNPLKKAYWTKENLLPTEEEKTKFKADMAKIKEDHQRQQEKTKDIGKRISRLGWKLTFVITVPLLLTVFLGVFGMIIGGIIAIAVLMKK